MSSSKLKLLTLAAALLLSVLAALPAAQAACVCYDGRDCHGTWIGPQPCTTRICGGDGYWYNCTSTGWQRASTRCTCP